MARFDERTHWWNDNEWRQSDHRDHDARSVEERRALAEYWRAGGRTSDYERFTQGSEGRKFERPFPNWTDYQPDSSRRGGFAVKGPLGHTRSDDRLREDVCHRLSADDEIDASNITVTVAKAEVTLEGTVHDRHAKRRAEDIVEWVTGVTGVHNRLRSNKGWMQELGDKLMGRTSETGHAGSGTRNARSASS
jgi:BON domain